MNINDFAKRMSELIERQNLTIEDISEATGLSPSTISIYINGKMMPRPAVLKKLAEYFEVSTSYLFASENEEEQDTNVSLLLKQLINNTKKDYLEWSQPHIEGSAAEEYDSHYNGYLYRIKKQNNSFSLYIFDKNNNEILKRIIFNEIEAKTLSQLFEVITLNILTEDDKTLLQVLEALKQTPEEIEEVKKEQHKKFKGHR